MTNFIKEKEKEDLSSYFGRKDPLGNQIFSKPGGNGKVRIEYVPFNDLAESDLNEKTQSDVHIETLADSIKTIGLQQPLVVYRDGTRYTILAGHGRYEAIQQLRQQDNANGKYDTVPCIIIKNPGEGKTDQNDIDSAIVEYQLQLDIHGDSEKAVMENVAKAYNNWMQRVSPKRKAEYREVYRNDYFSKYKDEIDELDDQIKALTDRMNELPEGKKKEKLEARINKVQKRKDTINRHYSPYLYYIREFAGIDVSDSTIKRYIKKLSNNSDESSVNPADKKEKTQPKKPTPKKLRNTLLQVQDVIKAFYDGRTDEEAYDVMNSIDNYIAILDDKINQH